MKYLSLFSGIGGFELGIQQAYEDLQNGESTGRLKQEKSLSIGRVPNSSSQSNKRQYPTCIGFSEIDKYATQVYNKHFNHKNYGDITKINEKELPDFDLIVGGFPCQSFSIAGLRGGFDDTRGTLFFEIARIAREKQPRLLLLENVKGLLFHNKGNTFTTIISTLDELGYDCQWQVLNSKNFGVPQNRERVFIVGHLRGTSRPEVFPIGKTATNDIKVIGELNSETWKKRNESTRRVYSVKGIGPTIPTCGGGGVHPKIVTPKNRRTEYKKSDISGTLTSHYRGNPDGDGRPDLLSNGKIRRLTPLECERLQGFPNNWTKEGIIPKEDRKDYKNGIVTISDTQRYKMCGNAVTVNVIKEIVKKLI